MNGKLVSIVLAVALLLPALGASPVLASNVQTGSVPDVTLVVTTTEDELNADGDCSLREAIRAANLNDFVDGCGMGSGDDTIRLPRGVYRLSIGGPGEDAGDTGDLDIWGNLRIVGDGAHATVIDAAGLDRALQIHPGLMVFIEGVTIAHGLAKGQSGGGILSVDSSLALYGVVLRDNTAVDGPTVGGGGLASLAVNLGAKATLTRCTVAGNTAYGGGGIQSAAWGGAMAALTLVETTVSRNAAEFLGGGIWSAGSGAAASGVASLRLERSTVSHNVASGQGAYQGDGGGVAVVNGSATLVNSTLSGNRASGAGPGQLAGLGGGLFVAAMDGAPAVSLENVTLAGNLAVGGAAVASLNLGMGTTVSFHNSLISGSREWDVSRSNCFSRDDAYGANVFLSRGHNLEDQDSCGFDQASDLRTTDARLGALADNGGPTQTHALGIGSPAINAGDAADAPPTDQRGVPRPQCRCSDIGAYEAASMQLGAIRLEEWDGDSFRAVGWVQVVDWAGAPVEGAEVTVSLSAPGMEPRKLVTVTGPDGWTPPIRWGSRQAGTYTLCVRGIARDGYVYNPSNDVTGCRSITFGPAIQE